MKLTIFGATGATGACLVGQALAAGRARRHGGRPRPGPPGRAEPPAVARRHRRRHGPNLDQPGCRRRERRNLRGRPPRYRPHYGHPGQRAQHHRRPCRQPGPARLLEVSGSIVADEGESPYLRYLLKPVIRRTFLRHVCADMRRGEEEIQDSDLDWTIFRPPSLTGNAAQGNLPDRDRPQPAARIHDLPCRPGQLHAQAARRSGDRAPAHIHRQLTRDAAG